MVVGNSRLRQHPRPFFSGLLVKLYVSLQSHTINGNLLFCFICSDKNRGELGLYLQKTFVVPRCLAICEPLGEARAQHPLGTMRSASVFSIGIAPAHPFSMSEQSPQIIKLFHSYMHKVTNNHYGKLKFSFVENAVRQQYNMKTSSNSLFQKGSIADE